MFSIAARRGQLSGHLVTPTGGGPWPGVVVIHGAFGLNDDIRRIADRFAEHGYLTLAPDFFAWGSRLTCLRSALGELADGSGRMFDDLSDARGFLAGHQDCSGQVGVIGFCLGGGFALLAAPRGFGASSVNYGRVPDAERVLAGACPIVASYGGRDRGLREHPERLDRALTSLGVEHDLKVYPKAGHSFLNQNRGAMALVLRTVLGVGYHGPCAEDAWGRIVDFFDAHLRAGAQAASEGYAPAARGEAPPGGGRRSSPWPHTGCPRAQLAKPTPRASAGTRSLPGRSRRPGRRRLLAPRRTRAAEFRRSGGRHGGGHRPRRRSGHGLAGADGPGG